MSEAVTIKGIGEGLLVNVPPGTWDQGLATLLETIDQQADFFRGARLALQLSDHAVGAKRLSALREALDDRGIALWAVLSNAETTRIAAADLGLALSINTAADPDREPGFSDLIDFAGEDALLVERTVRSGQRIHFPGHVVILGDVNPGAEIIAAGHVLVWGHLRGTVHAGAAGNETARVCALSLSPTQLRIAGQIAISPTRKGQTTPEVARVRAGQIVAEPWNEDRRR